MLFDSNSQQIGPWIDFTSVIDGTGGGTWTKDPETSPFIYDQARYRIVGQNIELRWDYRADTPTNSGTVGTGDMFLTLPPGFTGDNSLMPDSTFYICGNCRADDTANANANGVVYYDSQYNGIFMLVYNATIYKTINALSTYSLADSGTQYSLIASLPVVTT